MRDRAAPPHPRIYRVPPPPPGHEPADKDMKVHMILAIKRAAL